MGCADTHACMYEGDEVAFVIGDDGELTYTRLTEYVRTRKVARLMRLIIINPLVEQLPPLPVMVVGTCSTFSYEDYLVPQWRAVESMFRE